ncbi:SAV_2336 N-terminal domain-related protein [Streptomyces geranii]|uniref:SAV_2336 N-terminal domain-related protein n=1 Tax=Streptomyces geranii TaxID=2058923 RepID=UPI000D022C24|nr:SAV_2336 N-terminal domain-related protein [Streptomyces geranii]
MTSPDGQLAELAERLRALGGVEPSARELAEALWLARFVGGATAPAGAEPEVPEGGADLAASGRTSPVGPPPGSRPGFRARPTDPTDPTEPADPVADRTRLHADRPRADGTPGAQPADADSDFVRVRVPSATALPNPLALQRALRPLQHYRPPVRTPALDLDEQATAEQAAETRLLLPVLRATTRREARLRLLMDVSTSTGVWDTALEELRQLCAGLGAFREVATHYVRAGEDGRLVAAPGRAFDRAARAAEQLRDPTGRQLTLVLSDCAGPLWRSGAMQRMLHEWGRAAPVAVVQPLPQRMWQRTHLPALPGTLRRREGMGARLEFTAADGGVRPQGALPVPVLSPTRTALGTWARLLAGSTGLSVSAPAAWVRAEHPASPARPERPPADPESLVRAFRRTASRQAVALAVSVSAVPLTLPVMQLVQRAMHPRSGPSVLAEVLLSGLLERGVEEGWYEFRPGVREALLRLLPRGDAMLVLKHCGEYVDRHFGRRARNFPALALARLSGGTVASPEGDADVVPGAFAEVAGVVARRFGTAVAVRREVVDVLYAGEDVDWAIWAAHVLESKGREVVLRRGHGAWALLDLVRQQVRVPSQSGGRVLLLVGSWYAGLRVADPLREIAERHGERFVPLTIERTGPFRWETGEPVALWDTRVVVAAQRLLGSLGLSSEGAEWEGPGARFPGPTLRVLSGVPSAVPGFTVPEDAIAEVRGNLGQDRRSRVCAVVGPHRDDRVGLAVEYVNRYGSKYDVIWWAGGRDDEHRRERLARLGVEFGLPTGNVDQRLLNLRRVLRNTALSWLIVMDDWEGTTDASAFPVGGHVLVISPDTAWPDSVDTVSLPEETLTVHPVSAVIGVHAGGRALASGFFLAPGMVVTSAGAVEGLSKEDRGRITVHTTDGRGHRAWFARAVGELAVLEVPGIADRYDCLRLTDAPDVLPQKVTAQYADGVEVRSSLTRVRGQRDRQELALISAPSAELSVGGPVSSRRDGSVVGVVVEPPAKEGGRGRAVRIGALRDLCLQGDNGTELWHRLVRTHDLHHARRSPEDRAELYGLLAELEPPRDPHAVLGLLPGSPPSLPPRSWRDGAAHLYARGDAGAVPVYVARILADLADRRTRGPAALRTWVQRAAGEEQRREVQRVLETVDDPPGLRGCRITVEVGPEREGAHSWALRATQDNRVVYEAEAARPVALDGPVPQLREHLGRALAEAGTGKLKAMVEFRLPDELLWRLDVLNWAPAQALRTEANVFVRGLGPDSVALERVERWNGVQGGPLLGLRPPASLRDGPLNSVPLLCRHDADDGVLDEARALGYPLVLWSRQADHHNCAVFYNWVERELLRGSGSVRELLARVRGLWIRNGMRERNTDWVRQLGVYYDPPGGYDLPGSA